MKSAGLSSTYRTMLKKATKITAHASHQNHLLAKVEKQKALRAQAEQAEIARRKREEALLVMNQKNPTEVQA